MEVDVQPRPGAQSELSLPRPFGRYLLLDRIGRGGMAEIFLARATGELGAARRVVVKQIVPQYSFDPLFTKSLIGEAKLASRLSHNNIVRVLDLGREEGRLYIAMEYVEGFDLNQLLGRLSRRRIPLPLEFAILIVRSVLSALDYAHRAVDHNGTPLGVVHRDVSPANILVSLEGEVRLCDFGIARAFAPEAPDPDEPQLESAMLAGKGWYTAPEHARGHDVDARSDVFAAGVLLWELCAGRRMFKRDDRSWLDPDRQFVTPELPDRDLPDVDRLTQIMARAQAVDPATRYQSAREMLDELENYALSTQLMASQLRFGTFLSEHFGAAFAEQRKQRERAADAALAAWSSRSQDSAEESSSSASESGARPVPQAPEWPALANEAPPRPQPRMLPEPTLRTSRQPALPELEADLLRTDPRRWLLPAGVVSVVLLLLLWLLLS